MLGRKRELLDPRSAKPVKRRWQKELDNDASEEEEVTAEDIELWRKREEREKEEAARKAEKQSRSPVASRAAQGSSSTGLATNGSKRPASGSESDADGEPKRGKRFAWMDSDEEDHNDDVDDEQGKREVPPEPSPVPAARPLQGDDGGTPGSSVGGCGVGSSTRAVPSAPAADVTSTDGVGLQRMPPAPPPPPPLAPDGQQQGQQMQQLQEQKQLQAQQQMLVQQQQMRMQELQREQLAQKEQIQRQQQQGQIQEQPWQGPPQERQYWAQGQQDSWAQQQQQQHWSGRDGQWPEQQQWQRPHWPPSQQLRPQQRHWSQEADQWPAQQVRQWSQAEIDQDQKLWRPRQQQQQQLLSQDHAGWQQQQALRWQDHRQDQRFPARPGMPAAVGSTGRSSQLWDSDATFFGRIKRYVDLPNGGGYGFIDCEECKVRFGRDVYIHKNQMVGFTIGDEVSFAIIRNQKGEPQARNVMKTEDAVILRASQSAQVAPNLPPEAQGLMRMAIRGSQGSGCNPGSAAAPNLPGAALGRGAVAACGVGIGGGLGAAVAPLPESNLMDEEQARQFQASLRGAAVGR
mmetsp:Transcript_59606/g.129028  ORF Transcript_59606/g.129028 Transcript_59606/m.129028 type:complete len:573 (-) Transcript_59606:38-1756(-)